MEIKRQNKERKRKDKKRETMRENKIKRIHKRRQFTNKDKT